MNHSETQPRTLEVFIAESYLIAPDHFLIALRHYPLSKSPPRHCAKTSLFTGTSPETDCTLSILLCIDDSPFQVKSVSHNGFSGSDEVGSLWEPR